MKTFGERHCDLEQQNLVHIEALEALGWTNVHYVYDDLRGGLHLVGIDPTGKYRNVPEDTQVPKDGGEI